MELRLSVTPSLSEYAFSSDFVILKLAVALVLRIFPFTDTPRPGGQKITRRAAIHRYRLYERQAAPLNVPTPANQNPPFSNQTCNSEIEQSNPSNDCQKSYKSHQSL